MMTALSTRKLFHQRKKTGGKKKLYITVGVYLDRLMGTNVVQMTDPKFMLELRDRVWSDYDTKLNKRIKDREIIENEREAKLILKGIYSSHNRPRKFIPFHSAVLALDLGSRKNSKTKCSNVDNVSPIFRINERTNDTIDRRRLKLKSIRQRNVDYVVQQTLLEGLQPNIEHDEITAIESKIKEMQNKILDKKAKETRKSRKKLPDLLDTKI
ncbi:hypothetical protein HA402_004639 [Bradysia odoriphaga]|nr:hypothetical protein HA402_004639 [Bradysia odoriphaga]